MPKKTDGISRRGFIKKSLGALGLTAALATPLAPLFAGKDATASSKPDSPHGKRTRQWCMVIDLKKCEGCVTIDAAPQCTVACIAGHFAPKDQKWIEVYEVGMHGGGTYFLPAPCFQCENAPCVNVCPVGATYHTESGVVLIDHQRCIGCRMCMAACPFQRRFFNWSTPELPPEAAFAEYSPEYPVPAVKGTVIKCMFCAHFLENGKLPYCVIGCPMRAIYMGDLVGDVASNGSEVVQLSGFLDKNHAFRYKEELGTQPRVWYLPGYGENFNRAPHDPRHLKPVEWAWGDGESGGKIKLFPRDGESK